MNKIKFLIKTLLLLAMAGQWAHAATLDEVLNHFDQNVQEFRVYHINWVIWPPSVAYPDGYLYRDSDLTSAPRRLFLNEEWKEWRAFRLKASPCDATFIVAFSLNRDQRAVYRMQEDGSWELVTDDLATRPWDDVVLACEQLAQVHDVQAEQEVHEEDSSVAQKFRAWLPYITGGAIVAGVGGYGLYKLVSGGEQNPQEKRGDEEELLLAGA